MKKDYISPQVEPLPLNMDQSLCLTSIEQRMLEDGMYDDDSD